MRSITTCTTIAALSLIVSGAAVSAGTTHATAGATRTAQPTTLGPTSTGQPNQSCGSATAPLTPGNAAAAPGSAFNPAGNAGTVYAGQQPQNSLNTASVSQYDVACSRQR
jgi:hypothetical protein